MNIQTNELVTLAYQGLNAPEGQKTISRTFSYGAPPMFSCREAFAACAQKKWGVVLPGIISGSDLFTRVINDPSYQVNQRETSLLKTPALETFLGDLTTVIEFGPGDGVKSNVLTSRMPELRSYLAVEWSKSNIEAAEQAITTPPRKLFIEDNFLDLNWAQEAYDFTQVKSDILFAVLGSTLANFEIDAVQNFLRKSSNVFATARNRKMLLGFDCRMDDGDLSRAYGNATTAVFFVNSLRFLNKLLDADFKIENFDYDVEITKESYGKNVKMYLVSMVDQTADVVVDGLAKTIGLKKGEHILVGDSRKFSQEVAEDIIAQIGFKVSVPPGILNNQGICLFPAQRVGGPA